MILWKKVEQLPPPGPDKKDLLTNEIKLLYSECETIGNRIKEDAIKSGPLIKKLFFDDQDTNFGLSMSFGKYPRKSEKLKTGTFDLDFYPASAAISDPNIPIIKRNNAEVDFIQLSGHGDTFTLTVASPHPDKHRNHATILTHISLTKDGKYARETEAMYDDNVDQEIPETDQYDEPRTTELQPADLEFTGMVIRLIKSNFKKLDERPTKPTTPNLFGHD